MPDPGRRSGLTLIPVMPRSAPRLERRAPDTSAAVGSATFGEDQVCSGAGVPGGVIRAVVGSAGRVLIDRVKRICECDRGGRPRAAAAGRSRQAVVGCGSRAAVRRSVFMETRPCAGQACANDPRRVLRHEAGPTGDTGGRAGVPGLGRGVGDGGLPLCAAGFRGAVDRVCRQRVDPVAGRLRRGAAERAYDKGIWWMPWH